MDSETGGRERCWSPPQATTPSRRNHDRPRCIRSLAPRTGRPAGGEQAPTGDGPAHTEQLDLDRALSLLTRLLRAAYPHPTFPDGPYERTAGAVMSAAEADQGDYRSLLLGLRGLDVASGGDFLGTGDDAAETLLRNVGDDSFFQRIRSTAIVALYDDAEVWDLLGYEGASFHQGGYLHRGFDDLDWLPPARIEEYTDEPRVQLVSETGESA